MSESMSSFFEGLEFGDTCISNLNIVPGSPVDLFSIFDAIEGLPEVEETTRRSSASSLSQEHQSAETNELDLLLLEGEDEEIQLRSPKRKREKKNDVVDVEDEEGCNKMSHIAVERKRRKQMNEHLTILRSLMPCFYVKRGDQASIIGGVVSYISELQQVLKSLESKKQRKSCNEILISPRNITPSPIRPSLQALISPRFLPPLSPRTPLPTSPYNRPWTSLNSPIDLSPTSSSTTSPLNDFVANLKSPVAKVDVKFSGPNLLLKTISPRIPGQVVKIVAILEDLYLEILEVSISTLDDTMLNSFTIKIGIECQLSAEELAHQIEQTFCATPFM